MEVGGRRRGVGGSDSRRSAKQNLSQTVLRDPEAVCSRVFSCGASKAMPSSRHTRKPDDKRPLGRGEPTASGLDMHRHTARRS